MPEWAEGRDDAEPSDAAMARSGDALDRALICRRIEWRDPC